MKDLLTKIRRRVRVDPVTGCWNWTGAMSQSGWRGVFYPVAWVFGKTTRLNRFLLMCKTGPEEVPREVESVESWFARMVAFYRHTEAAHTCDNARCINPAHLEWKGHRANVQEQAERKRAAA